MSEQTLEQKVFYAIDEGHYKEAIKPIIKNNLNKKFILRKYQEEAFKRFDYATGNNPKKTINKHLLFHMATGSGKTLIMAGLLLDLYEKGYRNFIFFVNSTNIIEKTKDNFLNKQSQKYLFAEHINHKGQTINIKAVENFETVNKTDIHILFETIQGLHKNLTENKENKITFEDFENKEVVLLADEVHHLNASTKKKNTQKELDFIESWENTVERIFKSNDKNYLLGFTATMDFGNKEIQEKYKKEVLLFNYDLKQFRKDGFSKNIETLQADIAPFERALQAIILSQYRKKIFEKHQKHIKPVILLKSKGIKESKSFYKEFIKKITNLKPATLKELSDHTKNKMISKGFAYFEKQEITLEHLALELKNAFSEDKCLIVNSKDDSKEKQLILNNLEEPNNEYRLIFTVNMLNEGWDVLNLFDIVRLYNTQNTGGANKGKVGQTTIQEAQLIGRGARYCPFQISEDQELYKRKYDGSDSEELKICETLYYHAAYNPQYISELNKAMQQIGLKDSKQKTITLKLKDTFKEEGFYTGGHIYLNKREKTDRTKINEIPKEIKEKTYESRFYTGAIVTNELWKDKNFVKKSDTKYQKFCLKEFDTRISRKAMNKLPFYEFKNLQYYFPNLKSVSELITSKNYLGKIKVALTGNEQVKNPTPAMKLKTTIKALDEIATKIEKQDTKYKGTKTFEEKNIKEIFKEKDVHISIDENNNKELGKAQSKTTNEKLHLNLEKKEWHPFQENYGTSEEKYLVKCINNLIEKLQKKYKKVYLIRNEQHFKIHTFEEGEGFAPDYVLFLFKEKNSKKADYQFFIEPKGADRLSNDNSKMKEKFLLAIENKFKLPTFKKNSPVEFQNENFKIIGLPLYNEKETKINFEKILKEKVGIKKEDS